MQYINSFNTFPRMAGSLN